MSRNKINFKRVNYLKIFALLVLIVWFSVFLLQKIDLVNSDLGRFIRNGEYILNGSFEVLRTNFYSFTYPNYLFINHHWATGVIFYLIWRIGGFLYLHLFAVVLIFVVFLIFFRTAESASDFKTTFILSIILIPLIAYRKEVRPELFSYFFSAIFFFILWKDRENLIPQKWLFVLPVVELFWVNFHIYFFLGLSILGAFLLEKIIISIKEKEWRADPVRNKTPKASADFVGPKHRSPNGINKLLLILALCGIAVLFNPSGLRGALHPFYVYNNYGYRVFEEQPVWFLQKFKFIKNPNFTSFEIIFALLVLSFLIAFLKNKRKIPLVNVFLAFGFSFMAFYAVRNFALFGFFALPILANNAKIIMKKRSISLHDFESKIGFLCLCSVLMLLIFAFYFSFLLQNKDALGAGLMPRINRSGEFFKQQDIKGPIFNNYDIGGYLIYHLFPKERVFVDNRPECYPASFFKKVYIPMQENEEVWKKESKIYGFNAIFFYRRDATSWGQQFLISRINDPLWAPVFVDRYAIIFLRRNELNKPIIEKYEIPRKFFSVVKTK